MRRSRNTSEIVYAEHRIYRFDRVLYQALQGIDLLVIGDYRVHMYRARNIVLTEKLLFNIVDKVVRLKEISLAVNLGVKARDCRTRAIGVNYKVVNSNNFIVRKCLLLDYFYILYFLNDTTILKIF